MNQSNSMFESAAKGLEEAQRRFETALQLSHLHRIRAAKEEEVERLSQELERAQKNLNVAEEALQSVKSLILEKEEEMVKSIQKSSVYDQKVYGELHEFEEALLEPIFSDPSLEPSSFRKEIDEALPIKDLECDCSEATVDNQVHEIVEESLASTYYMPRAIPLPILNGKRKKF